MLEELVQLEVADDSLGAQMGNHGLPSDDALANAHVVDELIWMSHQLRVPLHHDCHTAREDHRNDGENHDRCGFF